MALFGTSRKALRNELADVKAQRDAALLLAHEDPLTGLNNRRALDMEFSKHESRLRRETSEKVYKDVAVIVIDVNNLKPINDNYGHEAGDSMIKAVAGVLTDLARHGTDTVARTGGDEFVVVLPVDVSHSNPIMASHFATRVANVFVNRVMNNLEKITVSGTNEPITVSLGVATYHSAEDSMQKAFAMADARMYNMKNSIKVDGNRPHDAFFEAHRD